MKKTKRRGESVTFDLVANFSQAECVARLKSLEENNWLYSNGISVAITPVDDDGYSFRIKRGMFHGIQLRSGFIEAEGCLWPWEKNATYVECDVSAYYGSISIMDIIMSLLLAVIFVYPSIILWLETPSHCSSSGCIMGYLIFLLMIRVFGNRFSRNHLAEKIKTTLGYWAKQALIVPPGKAGG